MNRGYATVKGWLDIAEEAYCDGERKTCEDMAREAYKTFKLFADELSPDLRHDCVIHLKALVRLLNVDVVRPVSLH